VVKYAKEGIGEEKLKSLKEEKKEIHENTFQ